MFLEYKDSLFCTNLKIYFFKNNMNLKMFVL